MNGCKVCPKSIKQSQTKESPIDPNSVYRYVHPSLVDRFSSQKNAVKKMVVDGHPITCHGESLICCSESIPHENGFIDVHVTLPWWEYPFKLVFFYWFFTWKNAGVFMTIPQCMASSLAHRRTSWAIQTLQPRAGGSIAHPPGRFPWEPVGQVEKNMERFLAVSGASGIKDG